MATDRLTRIEASGAPHVDVFTGLSGGAYADAVDIITGVAGYTTNPATDRWTRFLGTTGSVMVDRITRLTGATTSSSMTVSAGPDRTVEPLEMVFIEVATTGSPDTVTVTQTGGPPLAAGDPGAPGLFSTINGVWQYLAPATRSPMELSFTATAVRAGATTVTDEVVHTVHRHTVWMYNASGALVPRIIRTY